MHGRCAPGYSNKGGRREKINDGVGRACCAYDVGPGADAETGDGKRPDILVITFTVDQMDKFKPIVQKLVAATEKEPGTLEYEYAIGDDQKTVDIFERYINSHAAVVHVTENFGPNFSKDFLAVAKPTRFVVYGVPTEELKKTLADFKPGLHDAV